MKTILILLVLYIAKSLQQETSKNRCFEHLKLSSTEINIINQIKDQITKNYKFSTDCLEILVQRGFYKSALVLFEDYFLTNKIDLHENMHKVITSQKKNLDKFVTLLWSSRSQVQQIEPIMKWAQNENFIFIHLKLSMRPDSPSCVHCKVEKSEFTNSTLYMSSFGIFSHQPLRFILNLDLYGEINPQLSSIQEDSVGTLVITRIFKQKQKKIWLRLEKIERKKDIPIWWSMRDQHKIDMDVWDKMIENDREEKKKKKKKNEKEKLDSEHLDNQGDGEAQQQQNDIQEQDNVQEANQVNDNIRKEQNNNEQQLLGNQENKEEL
ncbi:hypothetical protein IMG5_196690 [Ichthyophthirius multifiliis]|uniref:CS domain-containing protein n=1 Tax=Ichthyophthirius multifiliis TaxID=5932 RepID=G0R575_ICHMU|nr:hypothetical protein IMG5_196690 [Ichthyophthirius multifiliis]EGR27399.1 hypothetical protein IMG5_196690 [Ichthyophthirius multifiliis]|eukprot:XP_004024283.1 hypothetical protein IMG5_196690 [Ichthyophthirius multifiliis]